MATVVEFTNTADTSNVVITKLDFLAHRMLHTRSKGSQSTGLYMVSSQAIAPRSDQIPLPMGLPPPMGMPPTHRLPIDTGLSSMRPPPGLALPPGLELLQEELDAVADNMASEKCDKTTSEESATPRLPSIQEQPEVDLPSVMPEQLKAEPPTIDVPPPVPETHKVEDPPVQQQEPQKVTPKDALPQPPDPEQFKVLLQNIPLATEAQLWVMLTQANLHKDIKHLSFRSQGKGPKALITFQTYASVCACVRHFHGKRCWGTFLPISATWVRTVSKPKDEQRQRPPAQPADKHYNLSPDAPTFVPGSMEMTPKNRAPVVQALATKVNYGEALLSSFSSSVSTEAGDGPAPASFDSETEAQAVGA